MFRFLRSLNTHHVGMTGGAIGLLGIVAPHLFSHASPETQRLVSDVATFVTTGGLSAAYLGRPQTVQSARLDAPAVS